MSSVLGIDFNSFAIDLVKVDENTNRAEWLRIPLRGDGAMERTRSLRDLMPTGSFYDDVYLVAVEKPMGFSSRGTQSVLMRVQGALLVSIPSAVEVWEVLPAHWKGPLGLGARAKPPADVFEVRGFDVGGWTQDARDALGLATFARDVNAAGIESELAERQAM